MVTISEKALADVMQLIRSWEKYLVDDDPLAVSHAEAVITGLETALMTLGLLRYEDSTQAKRLARAATVDGVENLGERNWLAPEGDADGQ